MAATEIEVRLLGAFQLLVDGQPTAVPSGRQRVLLASLALAANRPVRVDTLAYHLWGDQLPERVKGSLQTYVMRARRQLGADRIITEPDGYRLAVASECVDACAFLQLLDSSTGEPVGPQERLDAALNLWRGEPLTSIPSTTLWDEHGPQLTERYLRAVEHRIDLDLSRGIPITHRLALLRELLAVHPLRETLWERLIAALMAAGRGAEALAAYATCAETLAGELGVDPGPRLQELHLQLLAADEANALTTPTSAVPAYDDGGRASAERPPRPQQLPADLATFTGRGRELATLDGFLAGHRRQRVSTVVIEGPAGVGKTSLAVHWAHQVRTEFPDGQIYVDLQGHADADPITPGEALDMLLRAIGVAAQTIPSTTAERSALLRSRLAEQAVLLLLDNARDAAQVRHLLPGPGSVAVITSRNRLAGIVARNGAGRITLDGMAEADASRLLAQSLGRRRVAANPEAAAELVELCGRLPLALALTAERGSRFPDLPLGDLAAELRDRENRLDALHAAGDTDTDLRTMFSWSYQAVADPAARLFRLLGVYPGSDIDVTTAAALAGATQQETQALLSDLVTTHLVAEPYPGRYRLHDLLRLYAGERAAAEETAQTRDGALRGVTDYYMHTAAHTRAFVAPTPRVGEIVALGSAAGNPFAGSAEALAWLELERANLVATVRQLASAGWHDDVWRLACLLFGLFRTRRDTKDWVGLGELAVAAADKLDNLNARFHSAINLAAAYNTSGVLQQAVEHNSAALALARRMGDTDKVSLALMNLGATYHAHGAYDEAVDCGEEALTVARAHGEPADQAISAYNLSGNYSKVGRYAEAVQTGQEALRLFTELGNDFHGALARGNLAEAYLGAGDWESALPYAEQASVGFGASGAVAENAANLFVLGRIRSLRGEPELAHQAWQEAFDIWCTLGDPRRFEAQTALAELDGSDEQATTAPSSGATDTVGDAPHPPATAAHPHASAPSAHR